MTGYAKIFASLFDGSLRGQSDEILVFVHLLCNSSGSGSADVHFRKVSDDTGLSLERVKSAIAKLESPDAESRSPAEEGRRIVRLDAHRNWGWRIVNHEHYRGLCADDRYRKMAASRMQKSRERASANVAQPLRNVAYHPASASASASDPERGAGKTRANQFAEIPSWEEWSAYCDRIGLAPWYAKDKYLAAEQTNWDKQRNWRAYATRCRSWWQEDGCPKSPPKRKTNTEQEPDYSKGL